MRAYIIRRSLMMIPTVLGVLLLTFTLFALVAKDPARAFAGRQASEESVRAIRVKMGLEKSKLQQFKDLAFFHFPQSMRYEKPVWSVIAEKAPVSLAIQLPAFFI